MPDYKITKEEYIQNNGYSSHYFFEHAKYFLETFQDINAEFYREKIILSYKGKTIILKCHYNGHSEHYTTILSKCCKELATFRHELSPVTTSLIITDFLGYDIPLKKV